MTTIAAIAAEAFVAVDADITDAVVDVRLNRTARMLRAEGYDVASGTFQPIIGWMDGKAVFCNIAAGPDIFPEYVFGPSDELFLLQGLTSVYEGDTLTIGETERVVRAVQDIGGAGSLFYAVAR